MRQDDISEKPKTARTERQREKILEGALIAFDRHSFHKASMSDIAKAGGVSRASLYQHFKNKEEIFRALVIGHHIRSIEDARRAIEDDTLNFFQKASRAIDARIGYFGRLVLDSPNAMEAERISIDITGDLLIQSSKDYSALFTKLLQRAAREGVIDLTALGISAKAAAQTLINGAQGQRYDFVHPVPLEAYEKRSRDFIRIYLIGLGYKGPFK